MTRFNRVYSITTKHAISSIYLTVGYEIERMLKKQDIRTKAGEKGLTTIHTQTRSLHTGELHDVCVSTYIDSRPAVHPTVQSRCTGQ